MKKTRIDVLLLERGLAPSRERAQSLIMAGQVLADDQPITKAGQLVSSDAQLRIRGADMPFVSRGGLKLSEAMDHFKIEAKDRVALDIGASTGGFTDVLLQRGISQVFAVDVGTNQMDWKVRSDPRVVTQEKVNARYLKFEQIGRKVDLIVVDVSFISLEKILPALVQFASPTTDWVTLIKPQFEVGKDKVGKGGIVRSNEDQRAAIEKVSEAAKTLGLERIGLIESPITGTDGNKEFLAHWKLQQS